MNAFRTSLFVLAAAATSSAATAAPFGTVQGVRPAESFTANSPCEYSFPQTNGTSMCTTKDGNIVSVVVQGAEDIKAGAVLEGYQVCQNGVLLGFDGADLGESGFVDVTTAFTGGNKVTVVRDISAMFRLTQEITRSAPDHVIKVKMTIKNLTSAEVSNVAVARFADVDVDSSVTGAFNNDFLATSRSVEAFRTFAARKGTFKLSNQNIAANVVPSIGASAGQAMNTCTDGTAASPISNIDGNLKLNWLVGTIKGGASKSTTFIYSYN